MERRHAARRRGAGQGQRRGSVRRRRRDLLVEQRGELEHCEASVKAAPLELERPRIPAASASRRLLLLVQPLQPLQRALDLRDLLLDGVRDHGARLLDERRRHRLLEGLQRWPAQQSRRAVGGWALACGAGVHNMCCYGGERRRRWAPRRWRPNGMMREEAHTMRVPRGTRGPARTSSCHSNEASPTLTMMVDEQLPPARTVTGGAGGRGIAGFSRPFGLALRELGGFVLKWAGPDRWAGPPNSKEVPPFDVGLPDLAIRSCSNQMGIV